MSRPFKESCSIFPSGASIEHEVEKRAEESQDKPGYLQETKGLRKQLTYLFLERKDSISVWKNLSDDPQKGDGGVSNFCSECGRENNESAKFCVNCGDSLSSTGAPLLDNRYRIVRTIKSGGMGCVYKAKDTRLDIWVALKKMLPYHRSQIELREAEQRFRKEARLLSELHHGGLPKVTDFFTIRDPVTNDTQCYLAMTFIDGKDLESSMKERGSAPLPFDEVIRYAVDILDILSYLHSQSPPIIYRDIKPANIMVQKEKAFLIDFGIARTFIPEQTLTAIGTDGYASPEQRRGSAEPRSDLYSLGVLLYYLLTGRDPQTSPLKKPVDFTPVSLPSQYAAFIASLLEEDPGKRPSSAGELNKIVERRS